MRFVFVVGAPRSGTTLVGSLIGSAPSVYHPGEYHAFHFTRATMPQILGRIPSTLRERYMRELIVHATEFAVRCATEANAQTFCDASPWNLLIAKSLAVSPRESAI